jgi:hypothetical protein
MSNESKNQTLGMSHGTATGRLRKMILFDLLKRHNENICARCHESITNIDELSIEHLKPWEGISANLFWDLNNVAFSHIYCNIKAARHPEIREARRTIAPEGMSWCCGHKDFLPIDKFNKKEDRWNGLRHECSDCEIKRKTMTRKSSSSSSFSSSN